MPGMELMAAVAAGLAVALAVPARRRPPQSASGDRAAGDGRPRREPGPDVGPIRRWRWIWAVLAGAGSAVFVGGVPGLVAGLVATGVVVEMAGRIEPRHVRRRREEVGRDLPHVVALLGTALGHGADPAVALTLVSEALPGAAAEELSGIAARLALGADPIRVWGDVAGDPVLGPLGTTLVRAHRTGASVVGATERLAADLADTARAEVEDRARAVGVRAAVPLGLCLLPGFLLLGIVPLVAGLVGDLGL